LTKRRALFLLLLFGFVLLLLRLVLVADTDRTPNVPSAVAPATAASTFPALPPADPMADFGKGRPDSVPAAGAYRFTGAEPSYLWIRASAVDASARHLGVSIQLDGLYYPFPFEPSPPGLRQNVAPWRFGPS
jgi:hypothetical protein